MFFSRVLVYLSFLLTVLVAPASVSVANAEEPAFEKYKNLVTYEELKAYATIPVRDDVLLIDARPTRKKYDIGHIPGSINIPNTFFAKMMDRLPADKNKLLIFYCGGLKCPLSHKSAVKAEQAGYTNIKVFPTGFPDWKKQGNLVSVSAAYVKKAMAKNDGTVVIDARPARKWYDKGHVPGAISIPNTFFKKMTDKLPADKSAQLIFYCNGFKCPLSTKSAIKAKAMGYTNVKVFQAGYPAWEKAYGPGDMKGASKSKAPKIQAGGEGDTITVASFKDIIAKAPDSIHLVDVRDAGEYKQAHFKTSTSIPVEDLEGRLGELPTDKPVVFVCSTGARSSEAYDITKMLREEVKQVYYLDAEITFNADGTQTYKAN